MTEVTDVVALARALGAVLRRQGLGAHADLLDAVERDAVLPPGGGRGDLAVLDQLPEACEPAAGVDAGLVELVRRLAPAAAWTQTADYLLHPPSPGFLDGYAHATLVGPPDGGAAPDGEPTTSGVSVGLLLLGRDVHYPPHHHPADEVYLPLGDADWLDDDATSYRARPAGSPLHHRPWQAHAMRTASRPLLAVYLWSGDVTTPSHWRA
ncbi:dimethylsulfonioproprionate lyase family protein [Nocardioides sp. CFH 31398]|uniref:dimethylsulfonioproprionate lyase family protein n=1 Tax=Nocardioides sp. CFH 31398 TaxID=2919579 RepID=UPI001F06D6E8|nr:dimethylsulfonioproprionate lyase family protein [Nocardioides sp. CFH 31398]MCH1868084.1 dimethylsulfoniopropionate lyase [Nocardioides sp. CFH 31398]